MYKNHLKNEYRKKVKGYPTEYKGRGNGLNFFEKYVNPIIKKKTLCITFTTMVKQ